MMAAIVVPLGCRSIPNTRSCLESEGPTDWFEAPSADTFGFRDFDLLASVLACLPRNGFATRLAFLDVRLIMAIHSSWWQRSICCTGTSPAFGQGDRS